MIHSAKTSK